MCAVYDTLYQMRHTPTRKLADALFRGLESEYSFKVYPLTANITDQPAVFIISKRIIDKRGKGHQVVICIGETDSTLNELKKHKRGKCVKENSGNVVSVLKEKEKTSRLDVIKDLTACRSFSCVRNVYKPKIEPTQKRRIVKALDRAKRGSSNEKDRTGSSNSRAVGGIAKRATASKTGTRVQGRVDSDGRQHRLPNSKKPVAGKTKGRAAGVSGTRKKAAA